MSAQPLPPLQGGMLAAATIGISVITAMTVLDSTIANVALPTIAGNLGVASSQGTWGCISGPRSCSSWPRSCAA